MLLGSILRDFINPSPDFQVAVGVIRIDQRHRNPRIVADILVLLAAEGGVDDYFAVVELNPYRGGLRTAVGHQRSKAAECAFLEEVFMAVGHGSGHCEPPCRLLKLA